MKPADVFEFYRRLAEINPEPETELEWISPYTLLVAVALSAQATDVSVNLATRRLFKLADTPAKMVALGEESLRGGTVAGDHDVIFAGPEERLILSHRAETRAIFARGAIAAARFLRGKPAGLYSMRDVIGG